MACLKEVCLNDRRTVNHNCNIDMRTTGVTESN